MKNIFVLALAIALTACGETPKGNDTNTATNSATASSPATTAPADNHADMVTVDAKKLFADFDFLPSLK